ncbi:hypothetical protein Tco_1186214 [Tanacetum coccineum]
MALTAILRGTVSGCSLRSQTKLKGNVRGNARHDPWKHRSFKAKTMQEAIEMATELMDKRVSTIAERQAENKRKFENTSRNNQNQQHNKAKGRTPSG